MRHHFTSWWRDAQSCPTLCDPMDSSLPGSSVHGIFQAIVLEWIAISFSKGSSQPSNRTQVSRIVNRCFTIWATREVLQWYYYNTKHNIPTLLCLKMGAIISTFIHWHKVHGTKIRTRVWKQADMSLDSSSATLSHLILEKRQNLLFPHQ